MELKKVKNKNQETYGYGGHKRPKATHRQNFYASLIRSRDMALYKCALIDGLIEGLTILSLFMLFASLRSLRWRRHQNTSLR